MSTPNQFLLYTALDGAVKVDVFFKEETVRLTQKGVGGAFRGGRSRDQQAP